MGPGDGAQMHQRVTPERFEYRCAIAPCSPSKAYCDKHFRLTSFCSCRWVGGLEWRRAACGDSGGRSGGARGGGEVIVRASRGEGGVSDVGLCCPRPRGEGVDRDGALGGEGFVLVRGV